MLWVRTGEALKEAGGDIMLGVGATPGTIGGNIEAHAGDAAGTGGRIELSGGREVKEVQL